MEKNFKDGKKRYFQMGEDKSPSKQLAVKQFQYMPLDVLRF